MTKVKIDDLPVYPEPPKVKEYKIVDDDPLPLQNHVTEARLKILSYYEQFADRFRPADRAITTTAMKVKGAYNSTQNYLASEENVIPKATAITLGGLAGFVMGMRRYGIRKYAYAAGGLLTMAAFCYPQQTIDILRTGVAHSRMTWENFKNLDPPAKKE